VTKPEALCDRYRTVAHGDVSPAVALEELKHLSLEAGLIITAPLELVSEVIWVRKTPDQSSDYGSDA